MIKDDTSMQDFLDGDEETKKEMIKEVLEDFKKSFTEKKLKKVIIKSMKKWKKSNEKKGGDRMSRKTIGFVVAIIGSLLAIFQKQLGLSIDPVSVAAGVGAILTYIFFESKLDLKALAGQPGKWKDPKFWITVLAAVLAAVEATFQLGIPVEGIITGLMTLVSILFGVKFKKSRAY